MVYNLTGLVIYVRNPIAVNNAFMGFLVSGPDEDKSICV